MVALRTLVTETQPSILIIQHPFVADVTLRVAILFQHGDIFALFLTQNFHAMLPRTLLTFVTIEFVL